MATKPTEQHEKSEDDIDRTIDDTFPASDPPAMGGTTRIKSEDGEETDEDSPASESRTQGGTMAHPFRPGDTVKVSGIYSVILEGGDNDGRTFEATCLEGDRFPPTRTGAGAHYELKHGAPYSHRHPELKPGK
jgi:hypothetical protein